MIKFFNFVSMDLASSKGGFGLRMIAIFLTFSAAGFLVMGLDGISLGAAFILPAMVTQAFAAGTNGLDRFYSFLSLSRKEVVLGRFFSTLVLFLVAFLFYFLLGLSISWVLLGGLVFNHLLMIFFSYALSNLFISIMLPFLFAMDFKKARPVTHSMPLLTMMALAILERQFPGGIENTLANVLHNVPNAIIMLGVVALSLLIFAISMLVSIKLYRKRSI